MTGVDDGRGALSRLALTRILDDVVTGAVEPGDQLLVTVYAQRLSMSRTPVREAFQRLMVGHVVRPYKDGLGYEVVATRPRDVQDLVELLALLEPQAARAAAALDRDARQELAASLRGVKRGARGAQTFHAQLAGVSANSALNEALGSLHLRLAPARAAFTSVCDPSGTHAALVRAVAEGDRDEAAAAGTAHVEELAETAAVFRTDAA